MISHFTPDCDLDLGFENINITLANLLIIFYLTVKFDDIHLSSFKVIAETRFDL